MKTLFKLEVLKTISTKEKLPLECYTCGQTFYLTVRLIKNLIQRNIKNGTNGGKFCGHACMHAEQMKRIKLDCNQCVKNFTLKKSIAEYRKKKGKSSKIFCSKSCSATYNNTHKTIGIRRSKLEKWLEIKLKEDYSSLEIHFNKKEIINSELDIYIPSLKLAVELNGIFHYEPIYGTDKLLSTQNNDNRKFQACLEQGIELLIIDVSRETHFKEEKSIKYFNIIKFIIDLKLRP